MLAWVGERGQCREGALSAVAFGQAALRGDESMLDEEGLCVSFINQTVDELTDHAGFCLAIGQATGFVEPCGSFLRHVGNTAQGVKTGE